MLALLLMRRNRLACIVNPTVKNTVSFAGTVLSYTIHSEAVGVPADALTPTRYVTAVDAVLQIPIVEMMALSEAPVEYSVAYVPTAAVPCTWARAYEIGMGHAPIRNKAFTIWVEAFDAVVPMESTRFANAKLVVGYEVMLSVPVTYGVP